MDDEWKPMYVGCSDYFQTIEARRISVNELFEKKERLYGDITSAIRKFEFETGVGVKAISLNESEFDIRLDI